MLGPKKIFLRDIVEKIPPKNNFWEPADLKTRIFGGGEARKTGNSKNISCTFPPLSRYEKVIYQM